MNAVLGKDCFHNNYFLFRFYWSFLITEHSADLAMLGGYFVWSPFFSSTDYEEVLQLF